MEVQHLFKFCLIFTEKKRLVVPDYTDAPYVLILSNDKIDYGLGERDKEDGGLLYVAEKGKVCFIPTVETIMPGCNDGGYLAGIEQDCIDEPDEINNLVSNTKSCK